MLENLHSPMRENTNPSRNARARLPYHLPIDQLLNRSIGNRSIANQLINNRSIGAQAQAAVSRLCAGVAQAHGITVASAEVGLKKRSHFL